ncbi:PaaI family thioesterase [Bordetella petrii]|uniref:PaaI family thioesterase n=1 Tax=Bordetella petrii TaxID=94624 RepID=UPI001A972C9F|nr:PaaI family thioesterase [Bordetella petrii]MBO1110940.1 PaaI family thioesterase [Bordetella petrii]
MIPHEARLSADGWKQTRGAGAFIASLGPLWAQRAEHGWRYGFVATGQHLNPAGVVHGGLLQALIDHVLSALAWEAVARRPCVTVQTDSQFLSAVHAGEFIVGQGVETHRTRNLVFMRGQLSVEDTPVLCAQAIFKIAGSAPART